MCVSIFILPLGVISCRATNAHGQAQTSSTLLVRDTKGLVEATQLPETKQLENIEKRDRQFRGVSCYRTFIV